MKQKSAIHLLVMSNHIFKFILKTSQYPFVAFLCLYVYFIVFFFKKKHNFARLIVSFKEFQELGTKSQLLSFQNNFTASYIPISHEPLDQNNSLTPLWNNN